MEKVIKPKKEKVNIGCDVDKEFDEWLEKIADSFEVSKSELIRHCLAEYFQAGLLHVLETNKYALSFAERQGLKEYATLNLRRMMHPLFMRGAAEK